MVVAVVAELNVATRDHWKALHVEVGGHLEDAANFVLAMRK